MISPILNQHFVGTSLSDKRIIKKDFHASMSAGSIGASSRKPNNTGIASLFKKGIPKLIALSINLLAKDNDDGDYQDPDDDEILDTMFPDKDDDYWHDNYDVD